MSEIDARGGHNTKVSLNLSKKRQKLNNKTIYRPFNDSFLSSVKRTVSKKILKRR